VTSGGGIILASASPRRVELMTLAGIPFEAVPADICEDMLIGEKPEEHVSRLSSEKATAVSEKTDGRFFIGADTVVVLDGMVMGKPSDSEEAVRMLKALSGRGHQVLTGVTVYDRKTSVSMSETVSTEVFFKSLGETEIERYVASGCPMDKAGAYAMQGGAAHFVRSINGSYTNVIGLPMTELYIILREMEAI